MSMILKGSGRLFLWLRSRTFDFLVLGIVAALYLALVEYRESWEKDGFLCWVFLVLHGGLTLFLDWRSSLLVLRAREGWLTDAWHCMRYHRVQAYSFFLA